MARLPTPGGDDGNWGNVLNEYLSEAHNPDGSIKDGVISKSNLSQEVKDDLVSQSIAVASRPISSSYRPLIGVTQNISSAFTSGELMATTFYRWDTSPSVFRFVGCKPQAFSDPTLGVNFNVGINDNNVANAMEVEFWSNSTTIRILFYNSVRHDVWALVDDMRITDNTFLHADVSDGMCTWTLSQPSNVWRKWRLGLPATTLRGIGIEDGSITPTLQGFQLGVIGDSYVAGGQRIPDAAGAGLDGTITSGTVFGELSQLTGIDIWRFAVSGSGYLSDAGYPGRGTYGSEARLDSLAEAPRLDAIVVWGSANDKPYLPSDISDTAKQVWTSIHQARPDTPLIVIGPQCTGWPDSQLDAINNSLREAANEAQEVTAYIDLRNHNFMSGTGYGGNEKGDGNADFFISKDGAHPTHHGNRYWGENIARLLGNVLIPSNQSSGSY